jgi:adhesin/invasin
VSLADRFGNAATGYTGSVHFWSNDVAAALPPDYSFTAGDAGTHTFSVTFRTPSSEIFPTYISATDNADPSLTQTSNGTVVSAAIAPATPVGPAAPATTPPVVLPPLIP